MAESTSKRSFGHLLLQALHIAVLLGIVVIFALLLVAVRDMKNSLESIRVYGLDIDTRGLEVTLVDTSGDDLGTSSNPFRVS